MNVAIRQKKPLKIRKNQSGIRISANLHFYKSTIYRSVCLEISYQIEQMNVAIGQKMQLKTRKNQSGIRVIADLHFCS
jgi:hypothetical protein